MPDSATALRLIRRWELAEPTPSGHPPAPGLLMIETADGPFVLKELAEPAARGELLLQHRVAAELAAAGLPVPAPIPTRDGRTVVTAGGRRYGLYPWIEGRRRSGLSLSPAQCHELGALLGRLHGELDRMLPPVQQTFLIPAPRADDAIATIDRLLTGLPEPRDDLGSLAERQLRERTGLLAEFADHRPPEAEAVTAGYIHGAFDSGNLLYGKVGIVAILGWNRLRTAPIAGELVRAAARLFGYGDERGLDLDRVAAFVRGHATGFELDADQIRSAAHRLWWELLCDVSDRTPGSAALVQWWTADLEDTLEVFASAYTAVPRDARHDEILEVS